MRQRILAVFTAAIAILFIAGCASIQGGNGKNDANVAIWHGRLAVRVQADAAQPQSQEQSFSAGFELQGGPQKGDLLLFTPLGSTAATVHWGPGYATLKGSSDTREFNDLRELVLQVMGTDVPVTALFGWLNGQAQEADGWQADLSQSAQGKISAQRLSPAPAAQLRIVLDN